MSREVHVQFCERAGVRFPRATHLEAGLVANTNLGGDNCHRGAVLGALLGAAAGTGQIPPRFCDGLHDAAALRRQVNRQAATRTETLPCNCRTLLSVL